MRLTVAGKPEHIQMNVFANCVNTKTNVVVYEDHDEED